MTVTGFQREFWPDPSHEAMGDERNWGRFVPLVWHALADHRGRYSYPALGDDLFDATAWWSPLGHVLCLSLGWPRVDVGLKRWFDAGRPLEDDRLALVQAIWGDSVDVFAAWCVETEGSLSTMVQAGVGLPRPSRTIDVGGEWLLEAQRKGQRLAYPPCGGGSDPLHLAGHISYAVEIVNDDAPALFVRDESTRRATLILDEYAGWYGRLARLGETLPPLPGQRSWYLDVVVRPVGWLGTYRRSRSTGRWFAGRHRFHELGT